LDDSVSVGDIEELMLGSDWLQEHE